MIITNSHREIKQVKGLKKKNIEFSINKQKSLIKVGFEKKIAECLGFYSFLNLKRMNRIL